MPDLESPRHPSLEFAIFRINDFSNDASEFAADKPLFCVEIAGFGGIFEARPHPLASAEHYCSP